MLIEIEVDAAPITIESDIYNLTEELQRTKDQVLALVASTPRDTEDSFGGKMRWEEYAVLETAKLLSEYGDTYFDLVKLEIAKDEMRWTEEDDEKSD